MVRKTDYFLTVLCFGAILVSRRGVFLTERLVIDEILFTLVKNYRYYEVKMLTCGVFYMTDEV